VIAGGLGCGQFRFANLTFLGFPAHIDRLPTPLNTPVGLFVQPTGTDCDCLLVLMLRQTRKHVKLHPHWDWLIAI